MNLEAHEIIVLSQFIGEHWQAFLEHCENFGANADEIAEKLEA